MFAIVPCHKNETWTTEQYIYNHQFLISLSSSIYELIYLIRKLNDFCLIKITNFFLQKQFHYFANLDYHKIMRSKQVVYESNNFSPKVELKIFVFIFRKHNSFFHWLNAYYIRESTPHSHIWNEKKKKQSNAINYDKVFFNCILLLIRRVIFIARSQLSQGRLKHKINIRKITSTVNHYTLIRDIVCVCTSATEKCVY